MILTDSEYARLKRRSDERDKLIEVLMDLKRDALPYLWESASFKAAHDLLKYLSP